MERKSLFFLLFLFPLFLIGNELSINISIPSVKLTQNGKFTKIVQTNMVELNNPGSPEIYFKIYNVLLPPTSNVTKLYIDNIKRKTKILSSDLFPAQKAIPLSTKRTDLFTYKNNKVYKTDNNYPGIFIKNLGVMNSCGFRILKIAVYPLQYNPAKRMLSEYSFDVHITMENGRVMLHSMTEKQYKKYGMNVKKMVINPEEISTYTKCVRR